MNGIKNTICKLVCDYVAGKGAELTAENALALLETPADSKLGDLALPCFKLSRVLRNRPDAIAQELVGLFDGVDGFERVEAVGGYLNFFFGSGKYLSDLQKLLNDDYSELEECGKGKTVVLDFSSPNIAKRFHLGHLGTTVIGNAVRNIFDACGYKTVSINYLGDWGTQNGKQIVAFKKWSSREQLEREGIKELERIYVLFGKEAEKDPSLNDQARAAFRELESGNEEYLEIWRLFKEISMREYTQTYKRLGIEFDVWGGESFYTDKMPAIVEELREKQLLKLDEGASIVDLSEYNMPPALILKRDGTTLYPTRDIAAAQDRYNEYSFDKCVYVTSAGQSLHFAQWFKVTELMGKDWAKDLVHVPYGTMSFGGEKLASRTGNIILLNDVFDEAVAKARAIIEEKNVANENKEAISEAVGIGAVVFSALANSRIKDTNFTWEGTLSFEGNTGPYVQYTYARAASVLRRGTQGGDYSSYTPVSEETELIRKLSEFVDTVKRAANEYEPSIISRYALSICTCFNQFYHNCRILGTGGEAEQFRLALTSATRSILGRCLDLLGMKRTEEI